ncbi:MAG: GT4 family glycosyltransferase PelF [Planctomycetes bacterium]|nr:GT4 family glycosyltransferase PelF [Planctomycetota bacterium]
MTRSRRRAATASLDVCFLLEGTYPFVAGGVSSWVHQLIRAMPDVRFGYVHIGADPSRHGTPVYEVPSNVVVQRTAWLKDPTDPTMQPGFRTPSRALRASYARFLAALIDERSHALDPLAPHTGQLRRPGIIDALIRSREHWNCIHEQYVAEASDQSFLDYVWNWRFVLEPLLKTVSIDVPPARMYHTCCTGYAGALAAVTYQRTGRPVLLTEHGIYAKERRIEVHSAEWIRDAAAIDVLPDIHAPYFRDAWDRHFRCLSRACYANSRRIYTLYGRNGDEQVHDGADPERIRVVPNSVDPVRFIDAARRRAARPRNAPFTMAFAGRVTPIKDVRSLISATRVVADAVPGTVCRILGPTDEDPGYAASCLELARELGLADVVRFEGRKDLRAELADVDVLVLTSISEAQPLVILEAGAVGVPVVATDVGSCRELLEGRLPEDRALGAGGLLTPIASPGAVADAVIRLARDPGLRATFGRSLHARVLRYYDQDQMIDTYRATYTELGEEAPAWPALASS